VSESAARLPAAEQAPGFAPKLSDFSKPIHCVLVEASFTVRRHIQDQIAVMGIERNKPPFNDLPGRSKFLLGVIQFPEPVALKRRRRL